jgi:hypothetical protein
MRGTGFLTEVTENKGTRAKISAGFCEIIRDYLRGTVSRNGAKKTQRRKILQVLFSTERTKEEGTGHSGRYIKRYPDH